MKAKSFDGYTYCTKCQVRKLSQWTLTDNSNYVFCQNCGKSARR